MKPFTTKFIPFLSIVILVLTTGLGLAQGSSSRITAGYNTTSTTFSDANTSVKLDLTGFSLSANIDISDSFVLRGSTGNGKGDLAGISMELNQSSFGFLYNLTDDLDLEQGDGSRIGVGFSSVSSDLKTTIGGTAYSQKNQATYIDTTVEAAYSKSVSFAIGVSGATDNYVPTYILGVRYRLGGGDLMATYSSFEDQIETITAKTTGYSIGYGIRF